jgi:hypothetical protein
MSALLGGASLLERSTLRSLRWRAVLAHGYDPAFSSNEGGSKRMTRDEWVEAFCREIATPVPGDDEVEAILALAASAAHVSERTAAPVACWIAGACGKPLAEANAAAAAIEGRG